MRKNSCFRCHPVHSIHHKSSSLSLLWTEQHNPSYASQGSNARQATGIHQQGPSRSPAILIIIMGAHDWRLQCMLWSPRLLYCTSAQLGSSAGDADGGSLMLQAARGKCLVQPGTLSRGYWDRPSSRAPGCLASLVTSSARGTASVTCPV